MDFSIKTLDAKTSVTAAKTGTLVIGVFENRKLTPAAQALDKMGAITNVLKSGDITGKPGSTLLLRGLTCVAAERVLLVGLGADEDIVEKSFSAATQATVRALTTVGANDALVALPLDKIKGRDIAWAIRALVLAARDNNYRSDVMKSKKDPVPTGVKKIAIGVSTAATAAAKAGLAEALALANGMELSKDLAKEYKLGVEVLDRKQLEALKMGSFLSVTNGSDEPPKFIVLKHMGGKAKEAPTVLVGKGITFDTGGISLKPGAAMDEMKYDMCGAASVLGTFRAIAELQLKLN